MFTQVLRHTVLGSTRTGTYTASIGSFRGARSKGLLPPAPSPKTPHFYIGGESIGPLYTAEAIGPLYVAESLVGN